MVTAKTFIQALNMHTSDAIEKCRCRKNNDFYLGQLGLIFIYLHIHVHVHRPIM